MIIANAIFYNGQSADRMYLGENLVWEKTATPPTPSYGSKTLAGKFIDGLNPNYMVWRINDQTTDSLINDTDLNTCEFYKEYDGTLTSCYQMFNPQQQNGQEEYFERIDHIPDTSQVTTMGYMFNKNKHLKSINFDGVDTSNVVGMQSMFKDCRQLTTLDLSGFDTSKVRSMNNMFDYCNALTSLDVSGWDTSNVTDMGYMFNYCSNLTTLDLSNFDTSNVTNMSNMFAFCQSLTTLNLSGWNVSKVTDMGYMFHWCQRLKVLNFSGWDMSKVTYLKNFLTYCGSLTTVLGPITGIGVDINLYQTPLDNASAMVFINGLVTTSSAGKTIEFSKDTFDGLTDEQIAVATSKGWNVVRSIVG